MTFRTNKWCVKQAALLEMQHGLRVHFSSMAPGGETRCQFQHVSNGEVHHHALGSTEEDAFREAIKTFVARESESDQLRSANESLRQRLADLESQLASESTTNDARPNGSRKKTSEKDDAVSSGTF